MGRIIGIRSRVKRAACDEKQASVKEKGVNVEEIEDASEVDAEGRKDDKKSRSTMVAIKQGKKFIKIALKTDQDELDFALGKLPIKWRKAVENEDLSGFFHHHLKQSKKDNTISVPETYEGQLVLEFDGAFEFKRESEHPTIVLRKPPARHDSLRLVIRRIG